ncbi:MAG: type II toxin-antitoxin system HicA family toxin [Pyrinomonadaceae bacterium]
MKLPPGVSGDDPAKALRSFAYQLTRRTGSHLRLTTTENGERHISIPRHNPLRVGTFAAILDDVAANFELSRAELLAKIKF